MLQAIEPICLFSNYSCGKMQCLAKKVLMESGAVESTKFLSSFWKKSSIFSCNKYSLVALQNAFVGQFILLRFLDDQWHSYYSSPLHLVFYVGSVTLFSHFYYKKYFIDMKQFHICHYSQLILSNLSLGMVIKVKLGIAKTTKFEMRTIVIIAIQKKYCYKCFGTDFNFFCLLSCQFFLLS